MTICRCRYRHGTHFVRWIHSNGRPSFHEVCRTCHGSVRRGPKFFIARRDLKALGIDADRLPLLEDLLKEPEAGWVQPELFG